MRANRQPDTTPGGTNLPDGFPALLEGVRDHSEEAAAILFQRYHDELVRVIRSRYLSEGRLLRRLMDADDFVQLTFKSIFWRITQGKVSSVEEAEFRCVLFGILKKHVLKYIRHYLTATKRSLNRDEESLAVKHLAKPAAGPGTPEHGRTEDERKNALADLPETFRALAGALQNGRTMTEIAEQLEISERTAKRQARHFHDWLADREAGRGD